MQSLLVLSMNELIDTMYRHNLHDLGSTLVSLKEPKQMMLDYIFHAVMGEVCRDVEENCADRYWALLAQLFKSKHYTKFFIGDFDDDYKVCGHSLSNSQFQAFIRGLQTNTRNLKWLFLGKDLPPSVTGLSIEEREASSIAKLTRLTQILIKGISIQMSGFLEILQQCKHLTLARAFDLELDVVPSSDLISEAFIEQSIIERNLNWHDSLCWSLSKNAPENNSPGIGIQLNPYTAADLVWMRELKHVTHINFICESIVTDFDAVPHFPRLKHAQIHCSVNSAMVFRAFLLRNGQTLEHLAVKGLQLEARVTLKEIYTWCCNLQSLALVKSTLYKGKKKSEQSLPVMQSLRRFIWSDAAKYTMVPLSGIFSAPLLELVVINAYDFDLSDTDLMIARIARREILRNLTRIELRRCRRTDIKKSLIISKLIDATGCYSRRP